MNHGLSENSAHWEAEAQKFCNKYSIPITCSRVNVKAQKQQSIEALARDARYQAIAEITEPNSLVATGHHEDDQAETFFLQLKRGSGVKGLSAMAIESHRAHYLLVRPLLNFSRAEIEVYAKTHNLSWIEDESNQDVRFDRNFIRHTIMPTLQERWPSIKQTIVRSTQHCSDAQCLLDELAEQDINACVVNSHQFNVKSLKLLSPLRFNNLIRTYLAKQCWLMPSTEQLAQAWLQLTNDTTSHAQVKLGEMFLRLYQGKATITPEFTDVTSWEESFIWQKKSIEIKLPDRLGELIILSSQDIKEKIKEYDKDISIHYINAPVEGDTISVRFKHNNPTCTPDYRQHSRSLKKVLQELSIPVWQRKRLPFLYFNNIFVSTVGNFVCKPYLSSMCDKGNASTITVIWKRINR